MNNTYLNRVESFMLPFLKKNGYGLIKSEFVSEDNNWYLRLYIELSEEEIRKREEKLAEKKAKEADEDMLLQGELPEKNDSCGQSGQTEAEGREEAGGSTDEETDEAAEHVPGIDINDCAKVSRYLSKWLDKEDFIKEAYTLEVCSRGFLNNNDDLTEV